MPLKEVYVNIRWSVPLTATVYMQSTESK